MKNKFEAFKRPNTMGFIFSSHMENIDRVCKETTKYLCAEIKHIHAELFSINLCIREGLTNAIRHGNTNNPEKEVRLVLTIKDEKFLHIEIEDQGSGFDWKKQQEKSFKDDKAHGRGIPILGMYFTRYFYNDKGNILYLEKDIVPRQA